MFGNAKSLPTLGAAALLLASWPHSAPAAIDGDRPVAQECMGCHETWDAARLARFRASVHGTKECLDCHPAAARTPHTTQAAMPASCARCHSGEVAGFLASAHSRKEAPASRAFESGCMTCHGEAHSIAKAARGSVPESTCVNCHGQRAVKPLFGLPAKVWQGYETSVHGQMRTLGSKAAPGCSDCHGTHRVASLRNSGSPSAAADRLAACTACHRGATARFASSLSHDPADRAHRPVAWLVTKVYSILIVFTAVFLSSLILLELFSGVARKMLGRELRTHTQDSNERFTPGQRWQHGFVIVSFVLLVFTGFPLMAAKVDAETGLIGLFGGVGNAGIVHRLAGATMVTVTIFHLAWLLLRRRELEPRMLPGLEDVRGFARELQGHLLLIDELPVQKGKYNWVEKMEYWAFGWGVGVMGLTGALLWLPVQAAGWLPDGGMPVAQLIHGYEAILATVSVFLWHLYQVHLKPSIFPMSWTWLTGRPRR